MRLRELRVLWVVGSFFMVGCSASTTPGDAGVLGDGGPDAGPPGPDSGVHGRDLCIARGLCTEPSFIPSGVPLDSCYDGCNWCSCSADGQITGCTARACEGDAGLP
jgi:hypothetical protein